MTECANDVVDVCVVVWATVVARLLCATEGGGVTVEMNVDVA